MSIIWILSMAAFDWYDTAPIISGSQSIIAFLYALDTCYYDMMEPGFIEIPETPTPLEDIRTGALTHRIPSLTPCMDTKIRYRNVRTYGRGSQMASTHLLGNILYLVQRILTSFYSLPHFHYYQHLQRPVLGIGKAWRERGILWEGGSEWLGFLA